MNTAGVLILGSDSQIGGALNKQLIKNNIKVTGTTRKKERTSKNTLYFDLENLNYDLLNDKYDSVVIYISQTCFAQDEKELNQQKTINVTNTIKIIEKLAGNGSFIIFLSSNAVFNGEKAFYNHNDTTCPITVYGKHKNEVENYLTKNIKKNSCILRLTKVITNNTPFIKKWENELDANLDIITYTNKLLSPISIEKVVDALNVLITQKRFGIYHLGGNVEISFTDYCKDYFKNNSKALELILETAASIENNKTTHNSLLTYLPTE
jgi:dTDP-4-dehydrorhamnose reductase